MRAPRWEKAKAAFTLVELLAVVAIMVLMMAFLGPAVSSIKGGRDIIASAYGISGAIEQARTYAMANNTYAWVGFFEEDGSIPTPGTGIVSSGIGRTVVSVVAARNGNRYGENAAINTAFGTGSIAPSAGNVPLVQVGKLQKFEGVHMAEANTGTMTPPNDPVRPPVEAVLQVGSTVFEDSNLKGIFFNYPLTGTARYKFTKVIEFNPRGEANKIFDALGAASPSWLEVAIQPARGNVIDPKYATRQSAAAIMINGPTGKVKVVRP